MLMIGLLPREVFESGLVLVKCATSPLLPLTGFPFDPLFLPRQRFSKTCRSLVDPRQTACCTFTAYTAVCPPPVCFSETAELGLRRVWVIHCLRVLRVWQKATRVLSTSALCEPKRHPLETVESLPIGIRLGSANERCSFARVPPIGYARFASPSRLRIFQFRGLATRPPPTKLQTAQRTLVLSPW
ncbi:hypothetical protein BDV26DRAFT_196541 [Aspergillus bertholletiae]|uniref:Uncharacterized protein n=1 Tax=Aspergillus bertholletiae TaxID=1226010 RepID=A0A5N7BMH7_9EURO|nr:hypothetical protein BDV26DRAFT_196541 [Aspergillus bertholletiae]